MFSRISQFALRILLVATILDLTGGHWFLLQSVAWVRMVADYSRSAPLKEAVAQTFDGEHPCDMCKGIEKARQSEKQHEVQQVSLKKEFISEFQSIVIAPPRHFWLQSLPSVDVLPRSDCPLLQPPRSLPV